MREKAKAKTAQAEAKDKRLAKERLKREKLDARRQALHDAVAAVREPEPDPKAAKRKARAAEKGKVEKADRLIDRLKHPIH
ncbi:MULTISPECIES: hypothetical protein [Methylobacterium]|uniref:hypothetical protein n=1 Tax=Methylobacterium TaxID=407 RepID=UPI00272E06E1|nr:hypothetical protein [Methylobacterium sp.]